MFRKQKRYTPDGASKSGSGRKEYLQKGLAKIQKATLADEADKLGDALQLYTKGVEHLYNALKYDDLSEDERNGLKENYTVYYNRLERLKEIVGEKQQKGRGSVNRDKPSKTNSQASQSPSLNARNQKSGSSVELLRHIQLNSLPRSTCVKEKGPSVIKKRQAPSPEQGKLPEIPAQEYNHHYETPLDIQQGVHLLNKKREYAPMTPKHTALIHPPPERPSQSVLPLQYSNSKQSNGIKGVNNEQLNSANNERPLANTERPLVASNGRTLTNNSVILRCEYAMSTKKRQSTYNKNPENIAQKGLELLSNATEDDKNGRFVEAMKKYQHAVELIGFALKYGSLSDSKTDSLRSKSALYLDRVEKLKVMTNERLETVKESQEDREERFDSKAFKDRLGGYILVNSPTVKWREVVGLEMAKEILKEHVILPIKYPNVFSNGPNSTKLRSILFFGPPGSGKTFLMKAVLSKVKDTLTLRVTAADLVSKWVGGSKDAVENLFTLARENKPCIVFVDDMEYIGTIPAPNDSKAVDEIRKEFYKQMSGDGVNNDGVFFLGATSRPWALDSYMKKSFTKSVLLELPDLPTRMELLNMHMKELSHSLNEKQMLYLAQNTEGYSSADVNCLINDAWMQPVRKLQAATHFKRVRTVSHTEGVYTPCSSEEDDAEEMTIVDLRSDQILEACLSFDDIKLSLDSIKRSVSDAEMLKFQEYDRYNT